MSIPAYFAKNLQDRIEHFDDEYSQGTGYIISLHYGWSFYLMRRKTPSFRAGI